MSEELSIGKYKVRIKSGANVYQDHAFSTWPELPRDASSFATPFADMIFDGQWDGKSWTCRAPGFGIIGGGDAYGNGALMLYGADSVEVMAADTPVTDCRRAASTIPASEDGLAEVMLRSVYLRPDLSAHAREQFIALMKSGVEEVTVSFGDFRTMARAALASTRTASKQEIVTAGDCMARWLYGLSQSEAMPESWRTSCAELAQAWKGAVSGEVNAGAAAGGNTCKESVTSNSAKNGTESPETRMDTGSRTDVNSAAEVDVEAERKLYRADFSQVFGCPPSEQNGEFISSRVEDRWQGWLAKARTQADAGKDAALREAVGRLIKAKGRFHTEQNYKAVVAAYDATTKPENT